MDTSIFFLKNPVDNLHYRTLRNRVRELVRELPMRRKRQKIVITFALIIAYLLIYLLAISFIYHGLMYYGLYAILGIVSVLIFINVIHDAVHNHIFKSKWANQLIIYIFDLLGGNSFIWKKRHILLHHNYQNIAGWDSDIEQAGPIKIFPEGKSNLINRNQNWLIFFLYPLYLPNWIFLRDFKDFFLKNRLIRKFCKIPVIEYFKLLFFKTLFFFYIIVIPVLMGATFAEAVIALIVMMTVGSVFALLSLLTPHVNETNQFPKPDQDGNLAVSWLEHQFITTNDLNLNNWFTRNLMGNFNYHLVHHLFPQLNSVYAPEITATIKNYAIEHGLSYRSYPLLKALKYHYKLIKSNAVDMEFFEEDM